MFGMADNIEIDTKSIFGKVSFILDQKWKSKDQIVLFRVKGKKHVHKMKSLHCFPKVLGVFNRDIENLKQHLQAKKRIFFHLKNGKASSRKSLSRPTMLVSLKIKNGKAWPVQVTMLSFEGSARKAVQVRTWHDYSDKVDED
jgi:hypothetical protein